MFSDNVSSADNQQERLKAIGWVVGFVDGEGAFTVSINRSSTSTTGWQVFPEFVVTQAKSSKKALYFLKHFFNCGNVYINKRFDNHFEDQYRFCVRARNDLNKIIIPFFNENNLKTKKIIDFEYFCEQLNLINNDEHLKLDGLHKIAAIAMKMNRKTKPKFLESSQTIRQTSTI